MFSLFSLDCFYLFLCLLPCVYLSPRLHSKYSVNRHLFWTWLGRECKNVSSVWMCMNVQYLPCDLPVSNHLLWPHGIVNCPVDVHFRITRNSRSSEYILLTVLWILSIRTYSVHMLFFCLLDMRFWMQPCVFSHLGQLLSILWHIINMISFCKSHWIKTSAKCQNVKNVNVVFVLYVPSFQVTWFCFIFPLYIK